MNGAMSAVFAPTASIHSGAFSAMCCGIPFAEQPRNRNTVLLRSTRFDLICEANGIAHRLTKPNHPWTNGQVERMNPTIKDATAKRYHCERHDQLRSDFADV
jgi:transposase InsO family protein